MTLPPIRKKIKSLNIAGIRKGIATVPKAAAFRPALHVLKKQITNYEKYEGDPEMAEARNNLAHSILDAVAKLEKRLTEHRNKARA